MAQVENANPDPFDSLLSLEDQYHTEGYTLGLADGAKAGRIEGRLFGLQNGFNKHLELGRLGGRTTVWTARLSNSQNFQPIPGQTEPDQDHQVKLKRIEASERLKKHITRLSSLTHPSTLSTENSEDAVEEFESRLKDARAKATLISKALGETAITDLASDEAAAGTAAKGSGGRGLKVKKAAAGGEMEDFAGGVPISKLKSKARGADER